MAEIANFVSEACRQTSSRIFSSCACAPLTLIALRSTNAAQRIFEFRFNDAILVSALKA